ncbi:MAG: tRNA (adenosine(37)-N6)-dimethylallyltransferase MiaA [Desulfobacteraceae bacterium]|jgi:tRNA dimethylallyltransferase|nr:tRNA (adenosine(37)-N6)-dimethylallyltransferase MiaA [Desulfobacteraceae bacterium]
MASATKKPKVIVVCGPTGIGKTSVGIRLAEELGGEIISADSMQIYRYMDIGTAKPTADEQNRIFHHLIDIVDPDEDFDAVRFADMARQKVMQLHQKGVMPVVVGGTGLYIKALLQGLFQSNPVDPQIRERLMQEVDENGSSALHDRLKEVDPDTAERLHPNDAYRIVRALETIEATGRPISAHHQDHGFADEPLNALKIGLQMDREKLYDRIDQRVDLMIEAGFVNEVQKLLGMGYSADLKAMQSIGYRQVADFIGERLSWDECVRTLKRDTRRYAKRQFTWFGADQEIHWYEPNQVNDIIRLMKGFLE